MYNRYLRNDHGVYTRMTMPEPSAPYPPPPPQDIPRDEAPPKRGAFLSRALEKLKLQDVDTGDLLLLVLLFFLFEEKADDEVLIALGLLLIL